MTDQIPEPPDHSIVAFYDQLDQPAAVYYRCDATDDEGNAGGWFLTDTQWEPLTWTEVCGENAGWTPYLLERGDALTGGGRS